ncbi:Lrp/AsnC family transcriptional regulator for asnA, asnC and gidA [Arthrobacter silviterrae]|uniref:Lrp/AsnC family transcriptional regulator n=1 Tax=Arthrobacter silviterrae TaxID=2026658 RepID=A0ABX0D6Q8_9MICC|nr:MULTISPECIES: Lrp/AsnC family transcriptional regulator [Arthrobacter]MCU6482063.1 Lrp/AsnC family transcriptional regulator [Arthrobacter sp. A2-55]MDQ0276077.1 Lrp/AsnC family transcriptional regulator for asnA, asnC and gidA [Arthrobacter silviterrae]NGN82542.1 Lrp/AsnC family transcriptional regulator [Arthrobacter silviterrae]
MTTHPDSSLNELDEISKRIIEQLQEDGRRSYAAIAESVGLSDAAVRQRIKRLIDSKLLEIVAVTDPLRVGFTRQAMIGVRINGQLGDVAKALESFSEVSYIVLTAGQYDLLVEVVCEDDDHLLRLLGRMRELPAVTSTETFMYLKLHKQRYDWGTR